jgi:hypothetical protein
MHGTDVWDNIPDEAGGEATGGIRKVGFVANLADGLLGVALLAATPVTGSLFH